MTDRDRADDDAQVPENADAPVAPESADLPADGSVPPGVSSPPPRGKPSEQVAWSLRVSAEWAVRILIVGVLLYFVLKAYQAVHLVAFSFLIGVLIAAVLRPVHEFLMHKARFPPALAALTSVLLALVVLSGVGYFVADQISSNANELGDQLSQSVEEIRDWLVSGPFHLQESDLNSLSDRITKAIQENQSEIASGLVDTVKSVAEALSGVLLVILTSFFLVKDGEKIWKWLLSMLPRAARPRVDLAGSRSWHTLGGYVRGQVTIALFHAITITIALFAFRVPLAAPLGVLVFIFSFIPVIGMIIAGSLATIITLLEHGLFTAVIIAAIVVALVQLESHVLQPLIMSRAVEVHPLAVVLAVLAGTKLDGVAGALLAVPLVAVGNTAFKALHGVAIDDRPVRIPRPRMRRPKSRNTTVTPPPPPPTA
ncbi:AI-2E family transporter [Jatrophihabitans sp. YIM 134969]